MIEITIPLRFLVAARLFSAKDATRPYLNGVAIDDETLVATNGHYCVTIDLGPDAASMPTMIIPNDAIDFYAKRVGRRGLDTALVTIQHNKEQLSALTNGTVIEQFAPLEGQYPPHQRIMVEHTEAQGNPQFQWSYLALFEKAAETMGTSKGATIKAVLIPNGRNAAARVVLPGYPEFNGVVMPILPKHIDEACPYITYPETEESLV